MQQHSSRRDFIRKTTLAGTAIGAASFSISKAHAAEKTLKVGLIGAGGRGSGALDNCKEAAKAIGAELKVVAIADAFRDRVDKAGEKFGVAAERRFVGFDAYKKLLETDVELILTAAPPGFRPVHFEAAIKAGKHVFMEKPVAVDPPGIRRVIEAGELAKQKGLAVVAGTQRRHQGSYLKGAEAVKQGAIGKILGGIVQWNGKIPWIRLRAQGESDADYMARNWLNFSQLSGDHIVEQHVHNLDVAVWYLGRPPVSALGFGGRARRKTGDQFDFFSIDYDFGDGVHINGQCRQIAGCYDRVGEFFRGTDGDLLGGGKINSTKAVDVPEFRTHDNPYVQEHIDLLKSIFDNKPLNEARQVAESTLTAIIGRMSAYTGQLVRWVDVMENTKSPLYNFTCKPSAADFEAGNVTAPPDDVVAIPGEATDIKVKS